MKIKEFIEYLGKFDPDYEIEFVYDSMCGDVGINAPHDNVLVVIESPDDLFQSRTVYFMSCDEEERDWLIEHYGLVAGEVPQ